MNHRTKSIAFFDRIINFIIQLLIPVVILALILGLARIFWDLRLLLTDNTISESFDLLIADILTMFVVIELLRSIIGYFEARRIKITMISEAAFVFILREAMIGIYNHSLDALYIASLALLLLVLGGIRTLAIRISPRMAVR
jgi:uncharacterized membrane protein (DUF373 family)